MLLGPFPRPISENWSDLTAHQRSASLVLFCETLGMLLVSGVPILQSLEIVSETTGNVVLGRAVRDVQDSVRQGESIAGPLKNHAVFPPMVVQMLAVGEETGAMDTMLSKIADFYEDEVAAAIKALTSILEPLMIIIVGAMVGFIVISMYMPLFKVYDAIK